MKTAGSLTARPKTELVALARRRGVRGWEAMDKAALVKALSKPAPAAKPSPKPVAKVARPAAKPAAKAAPRITTRPPKSADLTPKPAPTRKPVAKASKAPVAEKPPAKPTILSMKPTTNGSHKPAAVASPTAKSNAKPAVLPVTKPLVTKSLVPKPPPRDAVKDTPLRSSTPITKDRILLVVSNPYWLNAYWELSSHSVQRAEAALRQDWHGAKLIIRLFDVTSLDTTSTSETPVRDIVVQGGGKTWYIDVPQPPRTYRADIGYVSRRGDFHVLARSNVVTPPKAGAGETGDVLDSGWDDSDAKWKAERMLAMSTGFESSGNQELREVFEERLGRTLGPPKQTAFGSGAVPPGSVKKFFFEIDAKLIVFGRTDPAAHT